jgi:DNA helicase HerA-like ATPase
MHSVLIGQSGEQRQSLVARFANRHGLIAGATGTGKTVTLQVLAEGFSRIGVPVFAADVKGDLSGISQAAEAKEKLVQRAAKTGMSGYEPQACPTVRWDVFARLGHPLRTTISDMGPLLLSHLLELNDTQEGVLNIAFRLADEQGLLLLDLKDLRAMLQHVSSEAKVLSRQYGNVSPNSVAAIQRRLLVLEQQGADQFFGEPALQLNDLMQTDANGHGLVHLLAANELMQRPRLYATLLLWLLAELFEELPEVGDADKPRLVFFFDEAHLLFNNASKALLSQVEQVVRLIRSKGVGIYFVTQNPADVPDTVLGQLGNRVQHALRAFTPRDQKAVRAAAQTFRPNPALDTEQVITELAVGEALVSVLEAKGVPSMVQRTLVRPPESRIGPATIEECTQLQKDSPLAGRYDEVLDRESAYEVLQQRAAQQTQNEASLKEQKAQEKATKKSSGRKKQSVLETMVKSMARTIGTQLGRQLLRGILGALVKR